MLYKLRIVLIRVIQRLFNTINLQLDKLSPRSNPDLQVACILKKFEIDLVIDIGANEGQFASQIRYFGYSGKIVSFEPLLSAHSKLVTLAQRDPLWDVYQRCAIGDYDGQVDLNISHNSVSSSILTITQLHTNAEPRSKITGKETVNIFKLDSILSPYLKNSKGSFLKIDTQGFEWQVLDGCDNCLNLFKGILCELSLLPLYESQHLWMEIIERLSNSGFILYAILPGFTDKSDGRTLQVDAIFVRGDSLT
ncbi:FkbM family methyltransferase [Dolichospermum circinale]|uniref:FkbM family methyltransferase n=1 Tax=Dolichospermum circinale TaxID=109265 RepID=UPI00041BE471|nr:FkbM family methyltransferase [Dolichospermum circinale]MDB9474260.1 FkbM family methyltransferase [Dolichospermum circinale CS-537/11]MDB9477849.1 FkbM family methyltransferase [Dolichospermum circinale CS-537/03]MDB9484557.1 FkbM family methyltransferase [Dolichospermum circinale CS-537/05]